MADTFNIDPALASQFAASLEKARASTSDTRDYIAEINGLLSSTAKEYENIEKIVTRLKFDPTFLAAFKTVHGQVQHTGAALKDVVKQTGLSARQAQGYTKELKVQQQMLRSMRTISKQLADDSKRQARIKQESDAKAAEKEKERAKEKAEEARQQAYLRRQGRAVTDTMSQQAGLSGIITKNNKGMEFSLAGVLKKAIELGNEAEKVQAYNYMAAAQFKEGRAAIGAAAGAAKDLRTQFTMSYEDAGGVVTQLTRAGVEASDLEGKTVRTKSAIAGQRLLATDMVAVQHVYGRSVETQLQNIMDLRNNFGMYVADAQKLDVLMSEIGAKIPGLSADEAVKDIKQMAVGMRLFGANVLDASTVYHTLMRDAAEFQRREKEAAATPGPATRPGTHGAGGLTTGLLGDEGSGTGGAAGTARLLSMPLEEIKDFLMFLSTSPGNLKLPQELTLGSMTDAGKGHRPGQWAKDFRDAMRLAGANAPIEFMKLLTKYFDQYMTNLPEEERQLSIESVIGQYGSIALPTIKRLSAGFGNKEFNEDFYKRLERALIQNAKELAATDPNKRLNELLSTGKEIANSLLSLDQWLSRKINDVLIRPINWLREAMESLTDSITGWLDSDAEKEMKKKVKEAPKWVRDRMEAVGGMYKGAGLGDEASAKKILEMLSGKMTMEDYTQLAKADPKLANYFKTPAIRAEELKKKREKQNATKNLVSATEDINAANEAQDASTEAKSRKAKHDAAVKKAKKKHVKGTPLALDVEQKNGGVKEQE